MRSLKRDPNRKFYYHLTTSRLGKKRLLIPRDYGMHRGIGQPNLARICVGPDVAHCFSAIPLYNKKYYVYRTYRKVEAYYPYNVFDSNITKERWIINPTVFILVNEIPLYVSKCINVITDHTPDCYPVKQKQYLKLFSLMFNEKGDLSKIREEIW
jgi:hypothetical protein